MRNTRIYMYTGLALVVLAALLFANSKVDDVFSQRVKISLREVGHQLLIANQDSTSLVLPVKALDRSTYAVSFQEALSFEPGSLVTSVKTSFEKAELTEHYIVEVIQCTDGEVAYSYEMMASEENTIVQCAQRELPENCYTIQVKFIDRPASFFNKKTFVLILIGLLLLLLFELFLFRKKSRISEANNADFSTVGSFQFYPDQNKLVKQATEISLSKKECELLAIFVENPNQVIKRDELLKKVWEDNGVFTGRSLDTYVSKLRKILQDDDSIKLTNVHGVGYKLEFKDSK